MKPGSSGKAASSFNHYELCLHPGVLGRGWRISLRVIVKFFMCMPVWVYICSCPWRPEEGIIFSEPGITEFWAAQLETTLKTLSHLSILDIHILKWISRGKVTKRKHLQCYSQWKNLRRYDVVEFLPSKLETQCSIPSPWTKSCKSKNVSKILEISFLEQVTDNTVSQDVTPPHPFPPNTENWT